MGPVVIRVLSSSDWEEDQEAYRALADALSEADLEAVIEPPEPARPGQLRHASVDVVVYIAYAAAQGMIGYIVAKAIEIVGRRARARRESNRSLGVRHAAVIYGPDETILHSFDLADGEVIGPTIYGPGGKPLALPRRERRREP